MTSSERIPPNEPEPPGAPAAVGEAILRGSVTLDLDAVLREIVDGARALTGARFGAIAIVDEAGESAG